MFPRCAACCGYPGVGIVGTVAGRAIGYVPVRGANDAVMHSPAAVRLRQRGVSIITAIFVLLMLSGVAAYVVSLSGSQQAGSGMDISGARVHQAARSGAEWGVWNAVKGSAYCLAGTDTQTLATGAAGALAGTLAPFTVTVSCTVTTHLEGVTPVQSYLITATACNQGAVCPAAAPGFGYVERQVTMSAWK